MVFITRNICIEPKCLHKGIKDEIFLKLKQLTKLECSKEYGHVLNILDNIEIKNNCIANSNSDLIFTVTFEAENFKPEIKGRYKAKIIRVLKDGIFLNIKNVQKVLIPACSLEGFEYSEQKFIKKKLVLKEDDSVECEIIDIKYSPIKFFACIGKLIF
jgi:DNA-directed RNA polymerase subunit E'/Rpb7